MKTKLLFIWAALGLLLAACEEDEGRWYTIPYGDDPYEVKIHTGMPAIYGKADGAGQFPSPVDEVTIKVYQTKKDHQLDQNVFIQGQTNSAGWFSFEHPSADTLWFRASKDTLSNLRKINSNSADIEHDQIVITERGSNLSANYAYVVATLTNTPTKLRLSVFHKGQAVEGATVQLYFTEQTYQDSLAAQEDFERLRPTYGYFVDEEGTTGEERYFVDQNKEHFLQTTNEAGEVYFDNLEPRNYWFRITKDTLSNEGTTIRTLRALPRDAEIITQMEVGIK
jgi:hypothetical protein